MEAAAVLVTVALISSALAYDMTVDLRNGNVYPATGAAAGIRWEVALSNSSSNCTCNGRGVLKLNFDEAGRRFADITMVFHNSRDHSFNIGDSRTNDGWARDAGTQRDDAEVHAFGQSIFVYGKDSSAGVTDGLQVYKSDFLDGVVQMRVGNDLFKADNGVSTPVSVNNEKIFSMDKTSENYDVYLGLNRVVRSTVRVGTGLCWVGITWESS